MKSAMHLTIWLTTKKANVYIYQISNLGLQLCSHLPGSACSIDTCHTQHQGVTPDKRLARSHVEYHHISHRRCRMHLLHILLVTTRKRIMPQRTWEWTPYRVLCRREAHVTDRRKRYNDSIRIWRCRETDTFGVTWHGVDVFESKTRLRFYPAINISKALMKEKFGM